MSLLDAGRVAALMCAWIGFALGASACVDNTVIPPSDEVDSAFPGIDAGEDGASAEGGGDAATDARVIDSSVPSDATTSFDAGKDASRGPTQLGLVAGGTVSHSPSFTLAGTMGPATAPVLRSPHYQLVGGMAVSTRP